MNNQSQTPNSYQNQINLQQFEQTAHLINEQAQRTGPMLLQFASSNLGFSKESIQQIVSGGAAGVAAVGFGQPYDMIKTRMQRFPKTYFNIKNSAQKISTNEGLRAFYVGSSSPLIGAAFSEALQFTVLRKIKISLQNYQQTDDVGNSGLLLAAFITGQLNAFILCPVELIKIQMQVQKQFEVQTFDKYRQEGRQHLIKPRNVKLFKCIHNIYNKDKKLSSFYRGLNATLLRDFFFAPLFFGQYFIWKRTWQNYCDNNNIKPTRSLNYLQGFCAGSFALFSAWAVIYPIDCIKTQIQGVNLYEQTNLINKSTSSSNNIPNKQNIDTSSIISAFKHRYQTYGINGFYSGIGISLMRTIPVGGMSFVAYELMQEFFNDDQN